MDENCIENSPAISQISLPLIHVPRTNDFDHNSELLSFFPSFDLHYKVLTMANQVVKKRKTGGPSDFKRVKAKVVQRAL